MPLAYSKTAVHLLLGDDVDVSNVRLAFLRSTNAVSTVPDLAFSEMEFLRRSKHLPAELVEEKSLSKSREKEKRRSERAQNEISEYFKPSTELRVEVEKADRQQASNMSNVDYKLCQGEIAKDRYQSSYSRSTSQSIDFSKKPFSQLDRRHAFNQLAAMPHLRGQMVQPGVAPDMTRKLSDRDTTYYTWSDSARSPNVSQNKQKTCSVVSTTPESVRKMLNDTGIFRNTGIDRATSRMNETASKEPVRSKVHTKAPRFSKILNCESPTTHTRKSSRTNIHTRQPVDAGENSSRNHHSHREVQIRYHDESDIRAVDAEKVIRPPKTIIQHYNPESGWQEHNTDREDVTHSHLLEAKFPQQGISRQAIAQGAYVKHAPTTSAVVRGVDDTNNTTLSAGAPEAELKISPKQPTKQVMYEESSAETAVHCPLLSSGVKKPEGNSGSTGNDEAKFLADSLTNHGQLIQSSKASASDLPAECQLDTVQVIEGPPAPSGTSETISNLPITHKRANNGIDQIGGSKIAGYIHGATRGLIYEGLPVRGPWLSRASGPISSSHAVHPPIVIEPLYHHQLENRIAHDLANPDYNPSALLDQVLHRFETPLMEYSHDEGGEHYDTFEGEYEQIDDTANPHDYDLMFSNEMGSERYVVEEEEHTQWELRYNDISPQTTTQQDAYEWPQSAGSLNQRQLPVIYTNPDMEGYHHFHEPVRELVRAENSGERLELNRFWQPRRQY